MGLQDKIAGYVISYKQYKSQSSTLRFITKLLQWTKQAVHTHTPRQRLEGESRLSQKVCHHHSPSAGLAHNRQFTPKVFATSLDQIPYHFFHFVRSSKPFSSPSCYPVSMRASEALYYAPGNTLTPLYIQVLSSLWTPYLSPLLNTLSLLQLKSVKTLHCRLWLDLIFPKLLRSMVERTKHLDGKYLL